MERKFKRFKLIFNIIDILTIKEKTFKLIFNILYILNANKEKCI